MKGFLAFFLFFPAVMFGRVGVTYSFEDSSASDDSHTYVGKLLNNAEIVKLTDGNHVLSTGGENGYMDLGAEIGDAVLPNLKGDFSIAIDIYSTDDNNLSKDGNFIWTFSSQEPNSNPSNYMMMRIKNGATGYTLRFNSTNYRLGESKSIPVGKWFNITYVHQGDSAFLYLDGQRIEAREYQNAGWFGDAYISPADLYGNTGSMKYNYIGRSPWSSNVYVKNAFVDNFSIVDSAMTEEQITRHNDQLAAYSKTVDVGIVTNDDFAVLRSSVLLAQRLQAAGLNQAFTYQGTNLLTAAEQMIASAKATKHQADSLAALLSSVASKFISGTIASSASESNRYPLTGLIVNPSFCTAAAATNAIPGWSGDVSLNEASSDGTYVNTYLKYRQQKFDVSQQLTSLPSGTYRVEVSTRISYSLEKYVYATTAAGTIRQRMAVSGKAWSTVCNSDTLQTVLDSIVVTDGKMRIGFMGENSNNDAYIDNVTLYYIGNSTQSAAYQQTTDTGVVIPKSVTSADLPSQDEVKSIISRVNDNWQQNNSWNVSSFWDKAVYQTGNMAAYFYTGNASYRDYAVAWASRNKWYGSTGENPALWKYSYGEGANYALFGDWQCCFQTYIDLYNSDSVKPDSMVARAKQVMSYMVSQDTTDYWWWADALYVSMPVMSKMYQLTGDVAYLDKLYDCFTYSRNLMYDEEHHLFFRDANYIYPAHATTRGLPDFWSRGNGWVVAGLAKILGDMPKTYIHYDYFINIYRDMIDALVTNQKAEGFWTESVADTLFASCYESSGTALDAFALIWGVRNGVLDECQYYPYISRAWKYLTTIALQDDGRVGYMQPIGAAASENAKLYPSNVTNFGTGAFLLAACEMGKYVDAKTVTAVPHLTVSPSSAKRGIYSLSGSRLPVPVRGINIINGKKVLVK